MEKKGERGFELDAHLAFAQPASREDAERFVAAWGLRPTYYAVNADGSGDVRAVRLTGTKDADDVRTLLQMGLEGGTLRSAEVGLRGFLRSPTGSTDYVPWKRNKILRKDAWNEVAFEEGVKYVLE
ncbi:hypothetical protein [Deinococcus yavapaiensis]|uniref:Uncharacterized protein n=1 Tax=Deinococcus yavapaiensis KR-236 TaxID=694435 RepID=A0A318SGH1_9DEIO|nr:hypothetical protein [Deinococcus yavapaiensis]PYE56494.1 hypothetical protein DES52_101298 [Deinococcus yavapaiensis KR-236]